MPLNVNDIKPQNGTMHAVLWENSNINLPLRLFYSLSIPLEPFDSGHSYNGQNVKTAFVIDSILFKDSSGKQEKNWTNLNGHAFQLSFKDNTADGSIYLGSEHCQFDTSIVFSNLQGTMFDIEMDMRINFNIDTVNLPSDGIVKLRTKLQFNGLLLYPPESLPTFNNCQDPMETIWKYIDSDVYESFLVDYNVPNLRWRQLKPKVLQN